MATQTSVFQPGNLAVITGAASGIGLALAQRCSAAGMAVILVDRHADNLTRAQALLSNAGAGQIVAVAMDVGQLADWAQLKTRIQADFGGRLALLALNAGIAPKSHWADADYFHAVVDTNLFGVVHGLNTLLALTIAQSSPERPAAIVITGSKQGITNPPGNPAYNASKAAVKAVAEHLAFDLSKLSPTTSVHLLVPGWTFTGLTSNFSSDAPERKEKPAGAWTPAEVVAYLEAKMREKKFYIICPDNDVTENLDQARMAWGANDLILSRPPLSRWREEWKGEYEEWIRDYITQ
ncbi:hypothetical protein K3495_g7299 [Podosphaera aphanis]|nr:hypothetical protein K3495_g7299 [Podosphaera aphanis]